MLPFLYNMGLFMAKYGLIKALEEKYGKPSRSKAEDEKQRKSTTKMRDWKEEEERKKARREALERLRKGRD
jgi:hypothetical protein